MQPGFSFLLIEDLMDRYVNDLSTLNEDQQNSRKKISFVNNIESIFLYNLDPSIDKEYQIGRKLIFERVFL